MILLFSWFFLSSEGTFKPLLVELFEFLIILFISILLSAIPFFRFGLRGPYGSYWTFLLLLFLSGVAGRLWIIPAGPVMGGYAWMPLLFWMFIIVFLLAATSPAKGSRIIGSNNDDYEYDHEDDSEPEEMEGSAIEPSRVEIGRRVAEKEITREGTVAALGVFFWIFLFLLLIAILTGSFM